MHITLKNRIKQVEMWLNENFPTPYPVVVKWCPKIAADKHESAAVKRIGYYGECGYSDRTIVIRISSRKNRSIDSALDTLLHEWAHAVTMPNERVWRRLEKAGNVQEHPDEFWLMLGRIYRSWHDEGGWSDSKKFRNF